MNLIFGFNAVKIMFIFDLMWLIFFLNFGFKMVKGCVLNFNLVNLCLYVYVMYLNDQQSITHDLLKFYKLR